MKTILRYVRQEGLRHHMILSDFTELKFQRVENEYQDRDNLAHHGVRYSQTILLHGFSGCGKTLGAERIAFNVGLRLVKIPASAMSDLYEEIEMGRSINEMFRNCLFLIERFDALAGKSSKEVDNFISFLDRYVKEVSTGLLIAEVETNLEQGKILLASAFHQFDQHIKLNKPTHEEINLILRQTLSDKVEASEINLTQVTGALLGFSFAEIIKISTNAAKQAILLKRPIKTIDIKDAIAEYKRGNENG